MLAANYGVVVDVDYALEGVAVSNASIRYTVWPCGTLRVDFRAHIDKSVGGVPRAGIEFTVPAGFEDLRYFAHGPNQSYSDMMMAGAPGVYDSTVEAQHFPFNPPSECGGHEDARWLALSRADGRTLRVRGLSRFHFDAHHNTVADYQRARHEHELARRPETYLHIDAAHEGNRLQHGLVHGNRQPRMAVGRRFRGELHTGRRMTAGPAATTSRARRRASRPLPRSRTVMKSTRPINCGAPSDRMDHLGGYR